ncbi:MAG: NfeD family protein [Steroidobacteraceae bacterium]
MSWFVLFAITAFALWFWRDYRVRREWQTRTEGHRAGERFIGQVVTLKHGISKGAGRVELGSRQWPVRGPDVPAGGQARIIGVDGQILIVDRLSAR